MFRFAPFVPNVPFRTVYPALGGMFQMSDFRGPDWNPPFRIVPNPADRTSPDWGTRQTSQAVDKLSTASFGLFRMGELPSETERSETVARNPLPDPFARRLPMVSENDSQLGCRNVPFVRFPKVNGNHSERSIFWDFAGDSPRTFRKRFGIVSASSARPTLRRLSERKRSDLTGSEQGSGGCPFRLSGRALSLGLSSCCGTFRSMDYSPEPARLELATVRHSHLGNRRD